MMKSLFAPRAPMPPAVRRLMWWMVLPFVISVTGAVIAGVPAVHDAVKDSVDESLRSSVIVRVPTMLDLITVPTVLVIVVIPVSIFLSAFVALLGLWRGQRRIKRAVAASSGRACVNCVYDLNGLGDTGACPECGRAFDTFADQRSWARVKMFK